jgi:serine/threonine protein kinase
MNQTRAEKTGYTSAVDWWSLGVTTYKLLTGYRPFSEEKFGEFVDMATSDAEALRSASPEYAILFQQVEYPPTMSPVCVDFISKLLDVNAATRLGEDGTEEECVAILIAIMARFLYSFAYFVWTCCFGYKAPGPMVSKTSSNMLFSRGSTGSYWSKSTWNRPISPRCLKFTKRVQHMPISRP